MSGVKKRISTEISWFEIDPDSGQPILLPLDLEAMRRANRREELKNMRQQQKKGQVNIPTFRGNKRKPIGTLETNKVFDTDPVTGENVLLPLDLEAIRAENRINGSEERPAKLRKSMAASSSTRKGLFLKKDIQQSKPPKRNSTVIRRNNIPTKVPKTDNVTSSPLLNMEEVEEELINKKTINGYPFKSPTHWKTKLTGYTNSRSKKKIEIPEIIIEEEKEKGISNTAENNECEPRTPDSTMEFNKLEAMCVETDLESPITAVSNLLQITGINSVKRTKLNFNANLDLKCAINDVQHLINEEKIRHEKTMLSLNNHLTNLKKLADGETQNKENTPTKSTRRSVRLQIKSPLKDNSKLLTSPAFSGSGDLRKNTLKKNLVATTLVYQDPRTQKGMEMYNAMRSEHPELKTPRTERKFFAETPNSISVSMKLHNQCILLQDTPTHK